MTANGLHAADGADKTPALLSARIGPGDSAKTDPATELARAALSQSPSSPSSPPIHATDLAPLLEETEEQAIKNRDGHLWECVNRIQEKEGFVYKFRLRKEYDTTDRKERDQRENAVYKKNAEIFPAVEMMVEGLTDQLSWDWGAYARGESRIRPNYGIMKSELESGKITALPVPIWSRKNNHVFEEMGYKMEITVDGIYLYLPDEEVLKARWNKMVGEQPTKKLQTLSFLPCEDIATDKDYAQAYIDNKMILSRGREFVHDHQVHIIATLGAMLEEPQDYSLVRERFSRFVAKSVENVENLRKLIVEKISNINGDPLKNDKEYWERMQKNMVLADAIPGIVADNLAATRFCPPLSSLDALTDYSHWNYTISQSSDFISTRHAKEISETYKTTHEGAEIPQAELEAQMNGISLKWLFGEFVKIFGEKESK